MPGVGKETTPSVWEWWTSADVMRRDASDVENIAPKVKELKPSLKKQRPGSHFERVDKKEKSEICKGYNTRHVALTNL